MASLDFLASDIVFPSDSNEPKLSVNASSKLPDPVDWSLHDYYSTALEKTFVPIHSLTDLRKLDPVPQKEAFYETPSFTVYNSNGHNDPMLQLNQDKMLLLLSIRKAVAAALPLQQQEQQQPKTTTKQQLAMLPPHPPALEDPKEIRAALRGALELTQNDMQHNGFAHPSTTARNNSSEWKWEDEILHDALELPVARIPNNTNINYSGAAYLIDDDDENDDYNQGEDDVASLPYCSSIEDDASSIAYSMSSPAAPPMPPIINNHFDDSTSTTTTTNTTLVSSQSSSVTAASSSRWTNVMGKLKSFTKPFKSPMDKRSNTSSSNHINNNQQQGGGLRRFLLKRHLH